MPSTFYGRATRLFARLRPPSPGEQTGPQNGRRLSLPGVATVSMPGFPQPDAGSYETYRRMNAHPTLALARSVVLSPVYRNGWGWAGREGTPQAWVRFVRDVVGPLRPTLVRDGLRALDYGWFGGEIVWEERAGRLWVARVKPLLPEATAVLADAGGNFAGLENAGPAGGPVRLYADEGKAFLFTYDGEAGCFHGRSRHENVRRHAWGPAVQVAEKLGQYLKKVAGLVIQLHYPEGTSRDAAGAERSNDYLAQQILDAVSQGRSVRLPNLFASVAADGSDPRSLESAALLAGKSQWVLSAFESGSADHAAGLLAALQYFDKLMFRGWLRPDARAWNLPTAPGPTPPCTPTPACSTAS